MKGIITKRFFPSFLFLTLMLGGFTVAAQENPPIPVQVEIFNDRHLNFGSFTAGSAGGYITIAPSGNRTSTGDVYELNFGTHHPAAFTITAIPGTLVTVNLPIVNTLISTENGEIYLSVREIHLSEGQSFVTKAQNTFLEVGGELEIPSGASPGEYSGTFLFTINYQ